VAQSLALSTETVQPFEPAQLDRSGREALSLIVDHLRHKHLLLILDNCEHLVAACAQLAEQLLRAAPGLRVLATSREALGVIGETSYPVPALSVPDPQQLPALEVIAQSEAIQLFVERARAVRLDFALTKPNAPAVAQICQRLDGIPLAIELAAARVRALTVEQIAARLDNRFALLTGGSRSAPPRQQTLRATIDWSYELLTEGERALLRRLSVFAGGWTLEAAEQVMGEPQALDWLAQLVVKSLAQSTQPPGEEARFSMLETIRQYAQEKLAADGESKLAHRRHLAYCLALAEAAASELRGRGQSDWLNRLDRENDNLRAALGWAIQQDEAESALRLAGALTYFWIIRWNLEEGRRWLAAALQLPARPGAPGPSAWQARALLGAGWLALENDPSPSRPWAERALAVYRELGDKAGMAFALWLQAGQRRSARDYAGANQQYAEALDLWQKAEDSWGAGFCLLQMGQAAGDMGNSAKAQECYQARGG